MSYTALLGLQESGVSCPQGLPVGLIDSRLPLHGRLGPRGAVLKQGSQDGQLASGRSAMAVQCRRRVAELACPVVVLGRGGSH